MIAQYFSSFEGIGLIGVISLLLSFGVFITVSVRAWRADPDTLRHLEQLPLESAHRHTDSLERARS